MAKCQKSPESMSPGPEKQASFAATKKPNYMKRTVLVFGLISGAIVSVLMACSMYYIHLHPEAEMGNASMVIGYLSMLVAFAFIFVGVKQYRDRQGSGYITFGKAFKLGFLVALIASTLYVVMWALMYNLVMPDFMDVYSAQMIKDAQTKMTAAELEKTVQEMNMYKEWYKNPVFFVLLTYMEILPVGFIVSLIVALVLKRKLPKPEVA